MISISFLVSVIHLGNHGDLDAVPFALLMLVVIFRFAPLFRTLLIEQWNSRKVLGSIIVAFILYLSVIGIALPAAKCIKVATNILTDLHSVEPRLTLADIPGFFIDARRESLFRSQTTNLPVDVRAFRMGKEYSRLIAYLKANPQPTYFINAYPSLFPVLVAGVRFPENSRAWIAPVEFLDHGAAGRYRDDTMSHAY